MRVFSVFGITKSGKTTTIERIITELRKRNYSVGSVKEIHFERFAIDTEGSNTHRHKIAGSQLVTARGINETDVLFQEKLPIEDIMRFYDYDFLVLEGVRDANVPKIITAHSIEELDERYDPSAFLVSGRIADEIDEYKGLKAISALENISEIVDIIEEKVQERLPNFSKKCCGECGYSCEEFLHEMLAGNCQRSDCKLGKHHVSLKIDGKDIAMVPFVEKILENAIRGVVSELDGYRENGLIELKLGLGE
ncbi:MAG: molybdopterin-guanine dinucleotide biosynthesis protein B [Bacillota bacterium]